MAVLCLRFCARAFSSRGKRGPLFIAVRGPLTIVASLVVEHRLQMRRLSNCGSRAQPLRGTWDPPGPGVEPLSPALAGRFSTSAPPGKPSSFFLSLPAAQVKYTQLDQPMGVGQGGKVDRLQGDPHDSYLLVSTLLHNPLPLSMGRTVTCF